LLLCAWLSSQFRLLIQSLKADIDAGKVDNTASAAVGAVNVSASESVTATQSPALSITKTATESTFAAVGDVLNYTIVVTNTGNVTLNNIRFLIL
jgi:hypothetical protein